jgi:dTDP-glucose 4,6-dehydratase
MNVNRQMVIVMSKSQLDARDSGPIIVTGGAGFIGSNFVLDWCRSQSSRIVTIDKLTYAGNLRNLASIAEHPGHTFVHGDIGDVGLVQKLIVECQPRAIINFAAESHVDRSIHGPEDFITTNILGTFRLLECARGYWEELSGPLKERFRFLHVSTDEVYGSLSPEEQPFHEQTRYAPSSPYSASKAASDHLVSAWHHTYGLPVLITNCSNNYGPYQFPEKLIPLVIRNALQGKALPIYGDGKQIRDWLYVEDHCRAICRVLEAGVPGETYNIGGNNEKANIDVVEAICSLLDKMCPSPRGQSYSEQIAFVKDRPGHDRRYAINAGKIMNDLGWQPAESFETGIVKTVRWYLENSRWVEDVSSGAYREWIAKQYA